VSDPAAGDPAQASPGTPVDGPRGRILGLDPGQARIGVAISDPARRVAIPLGTVRTGPPHDLMTIGSLVREHDVVELVVGLPLQLSGRRSEAATHAEAFADALRQTFGLPVTMQDERLSTVEAERGLKAAGTTGRERRRVIDRSAAAVILQAYLDRTR
jgi:putative holliday junction resolvase